MYLLHSIIYWTLPKSLSLIIGTVKQALHWHCGQALNVQRISALTYGHGWHVALEQRYFIFKIFCLNHYCCPLAERETARVNVHLGDADEPQRGRESEPWSDRTLKQQVRQLVLLLKAKGGVVEHPTVQVTRVLYLQLVDVAPEPHELPRQLLVLQAHVCLMERDRKQWCSNSLLIYRLITFSTRILA